MSDSSAEKVEEPKVVPATDEKKVPVAAVAAERAEKRAAKAEAADLRQELAKAKESGLDMEALVQTLSAAATEAVKAQVEEAVKPFKDEVTRWKSATKLRLSEPQAEALFAVQSKYPGMPEAQALTLAAMEKPDLFPQPSQPSAGRPMLHGGVPVSGNSLAATSGSDDFMSKMRQAAKDKDVLGAQHWATQEFNRRILSAWRNRPST